MQTRIRLSALFAALTFSVTMCLGQMDRASLSGTVTDSSGALVPGTKVQAVEKETRATFNAATNASGVFNFIGLPIGSYAVSRSEEGCSTAITPKVGLTGNSDERGEIIMSPSA